MTSSFFQRILFRGVDSLGFLAFSFASNKMYLPPVGAPCNSCSAGSNCGTTKGGNRHKARGAGGSREDRASTNNDNNTNRDNNQYRWGDNVQQAQQ